MGSGKGGGGNQDWNSVAYGNAYNAASQGQDYNTVMSNAGQYGDAMDAGYKAFQPAPAFEMPSFEFPNFSESSSSSYEERQAQYDQQLADQQQQLQEAEDARLRAEGISNRDQLYSAYMDAAGTATDYVNNEITNEMANARLMGTDYNIDDESKTKRISDYFASIWGEGEQTQLEGYINEWGNPTGFTEFTVQRGDGSAYEGTEGSETSVGTSQGQRPSIIAEDEEEEGLGGTAQTILGA